MTRLALTLACGEYDYLQPLRDGRVRPEGIDLTLVPVACATRHARMLQRAYDASEFSMGSYLVARAQGLTWLAAIPIFPRRMFCQRYGFVRAADAVAPGALAGRRIGILSYQNSLAIFFKGMLHHDHGVAPTDVTWVTVGDERIPTALPPGVRIERAAAGASLEALLRAGDIDALVDPDLPRSWRAGDRTLARLFPDYEAVERAGYLRSKVFPIMHPIVIQQAILDRHPWVADSLCAAFVEARAIHDAFLDQPHRLSLVWPRVEDERAWFGGTPFYQGFAANRHDVAAMIELAREQGLLARDLTPEALFAPSTLHT